MMYLPFEHLPDDHRITFLPENWVADVADGTLMGFEVPIIDRETLEPTGDYVWLTSPFVETVAAAYARAEQAVKDAMQAVAHNR